jgi:hypothetical protein
MIWVLFRFTVRIGTKKSRAQGLESLAVWTQSRLFKVRIKECVVAEEINIIFKSQILYTKKIRKVP